MVRNRKRKTQIGKTDPNLMLEAVKNTQIGGLSIKRASIQFAIPRTTLKRYIDKCKNLDINWDHATLDDLPPMSPNYATRQIFDENEESLLANYLIKCAQLHHGLTPKAARKLAFEFAKANNKRMPQSWEENKLAGEDWFTLFLKRNQDVAIRTPEATSLARSMGFNRPIVTKFFNNLEQIYERYNLGPTNIYNMDETGLTTTQNAVKVLAQKGCKQVGQVTSAERGKTITVCCAINAYGNSVPPFIIFPFVHFKQHMIKGAPYGTVGFANPSGWINAELFIEWLKHFITFSKASKTSPALLIMDNHEAHISIRAVKLAKDSGVLLLTLPPHTSHRLQPLDKTVYGPLKHYYNDACR